MKIVRRLKPRTCIRYAQYLAVKVGNWSEASKLSILIFESSFKLLDFLLDETGQYLFSGYVVSVIVLELI